MNYIFTIPGVKFFLSKRLSQDTLENFFGCQRQRGRTSENPNVQEFCKNTQALRIVNSVCGDVPKGNCYRKKKKSVDVKSESKPLPKRRRLRQKSKLKENAIPNHEMEISSGDEPVIKPKGEVYDVTASTTEQDESNLLEDKDDLLEGTSSSMEKNDVSDVSDENENDKLTALSESFKFESPKPETSTLTKVSTRDEESDNSSHLSNNVLLHHDKSLTESTDHGTYASHDLTEKVYVVSQQYIHTAFQDQVVDLALESGASNEAMVRGFGIVLQRQDVWTLKNSGWLNDQLSYLFYVLHI